MLYAYALRDANTIVYTRQCNFYYMYTFKCDVTIDHRVIVAVSP